MYVTLKSRFQLKRFFTSKNITRENTFNMVRIFTGCYIIFCVVVLFISNKKVCYLLMIYKTRLFKFLNKRVIRQCVKLKIILYNC